jgi:hypothetical protein
MEAGGIGEMMQNLLILGIAGTGSTISTGKIAVYKWGRDWGGDFGGE